MSRATFSGRIVVPDPNSNGPFHRYNLIEKQIYFSAFHLSPRSASQYIEALSAFGIVWLNGYSNSIYQLAMLAETLNIQAPQLKAVITTSEKLTYEMRQVVERVFNTHVYEEYGTVEDCFYVCENEHGEKLINPDAGILEVVDSQFRQVSPGIEGEVLATGFIRPYQPFIRYRIGDIASISESASSCGRQMPVLKEIVGRQEDTIYGSDGRRMVRFHGVFVDQPNIYEGQIIQESLQHIRVRIVPKPDFSKADEDSIRSRIQQRLTTDMVVSIDLSDHIERTSAGKFKAVVSNLSAEEKSKIANSI
jgi:phenylacetate-CoA ligase